MTSREPYVPDPAWVAETVARTRAEQGLPPTIEDPLVYERVASLYGPWLDAQQANAKTATRKTQRAA